MKDLVGMAEQFSVMMDTSHRTTKRNVHGDQKGMSERGQLQENPCPVPSGELSEGCETPKAAYELSN